MKYRSNLLFILMLLTACVTNDLSESVTSDLPEYWDNSVALSDELWPTLDWWKSFESQELDGFIQEVRQSNLDIENNRRNLEAAQLRLREAGFNLIPTPTLLIGATESNGATTTSDSLDLTILLSYESILSKPYTFQSSLYGYRSTQAQSIDFAINTLSTAASIYFQLLLVRNKIEVAELNLNNAEAIYQIATARVIQGVDLPTESFREQITVQNEGTRLKQLNQEELSLLASLSLLLGETVNEIDLTETSIEQIAIPPVSLGMPSELLVRRPDILQAQANLNKAQANYSLTRSSLLPSLNIIARSHSSGSVMSSVLNRDAFVSMLNASLSQLVIDNGSRRRAISQSRLILENEINNYRKVVLGSFNEVQVLLSNQLLLEELADLYLNQLNLSKQSFRISQERYAQGLDNFETVLNTQNMLYAKRIDVLNNKLQRLNGVIALYVAMGGGWSDELAPELIM